MSLNAKYLACLAQYPLLTKSVTSGVLAALNELIATAVSGQYNETTVNVLGKKIKTRHIFSKKTLLMVIYGAFIATPISHQLYVVLGRLFPGKLSPARKAAQIITSLCTISPVLSAVFVSWLSVINGYRVKTSDVKQELQRVVLVIKAGMKTSFWPIYRKSAQTTLVAMVFAQSFLPQQLWVVFFTFVFFVLGTIQNTRFKLSQAAQARKDV